MPSPTSLTLCLNEVIIRKFKADTGSAEDNPTPFSFNVFIERLPDAIAELTAGMVEEYCKCSSLSEKERMVLRRFAYDVSLDAKFALT